MRPARGTARLHPRLHPRLDLVGLVGVDIKGLGVLFRNLAIDHHFAHALQTRQIEHGIEQDVLHDRAETARARLSFHRPLRDRIEGAIGKGETNALHVEQALILFDEGVLRLGQDVDQRPLIQVLEGGDDRQPAHELGNQAELEQVLGLDVLEDLARLALVRGEDVGAEADARTLAALGNDLVESGEGTPADEQDIGRVDLQKFLLRVLAPALGRHARHGALHDLEKGLLHTLAGDVPRDRRVVGLARDLVHLVDVDDAALGPFHVVIRRLQELEDDVLHVLAHVAGLGERGGVGHREGDVENARQCLSEKRLAAPCRSDQQDIRLGELHVVVLRVVVQAFVVVVHGDGQHTLGAILTDDVVVEDGADVLRRRNTIPRLDQIALVLLADDVHAQLDAFVADEHGRAGNELADFVLAFSAEGAVEGVLGIAAGGFAHGFSVGSFPRRSCYPHARVAYSPLIGGLDRFRSITLPGDSLSNP